MPSCCDKCRHPDDNVNKLYLFWCSSGVTPTSAANVIDVEATGSFFTQTTSQTVFTMLSRGTTSGTNLIGNETYCGYTGTVGVGNYRNNAVNKPNVTSQQNYGLQLSVDQGATGGGMGDKIYMHAKEIMA